MARSAELRAVVAPETDSRALEREADKVEQSMSEAVSGLAAGVDTNSLRRKLERAIPGGGILGGAIDRARGGGRGPSRGGGGGGAGATQTAGTGIQARQLGALNDIHETLEKIGQSGGVGGGGGGGGLLSGFGIARLLAGAGGAGSLGIGALATIGGASGLLGGKGFLDALNGKPQSEQGPIMQSAMEGLQQFVGSPAGPFGALGKIAEGGLEILSTGQADKFGQALSNSVQWPDPSWLENLANMQIDAPDWVSSLQLDVPDWLERLFDSGPPQSQGDVSGEGGGYGYDSSPSGSEREIKERARRRGDGSGGGSGTSDVNADFGDIVVELALNQTTLSRALNDALDGAADEAAKIAQRELEKQLRKASDPALTARMP